MKILNIWVFACTSENGAPILHFKKTILKLESILMFLSFLLKFHVKLQKFTCQPYFLNNTPLVQPIPFQKEYFIPTLIAKLEEVNHSFVKGEGRFEICTSYSYNFESSIHFESIAGCPRLLKFLKKPSKTQYSPKNCNNPKIVAFDSISYILKFIGRDLVLWTSVLIIILSSLFLAA